MEVAEEFEEQFYTASEQLSNILIRFWESVENDYKNMEEKKFIKGVKSLERFYRVLAMPSEKEVLDNLNEQEKKKIEEIKQQKDKKSEDIENKIHEVMLEFAEKRLNILIEMFSKSRLFMKDLEIEFRVESTEDAERIKKMITGLETPLEGYKVRVWT